MPTVTTSERSLETLRQRDCLLPSHTLNLFETVSCSFILFFNNKCTNEKNNKKGNKEGREERYTHGWVILTSKAHPLQLLLFHSQKLGDTGLNFSKQV